MDESVEFPDPDMEFLDSGLSSLGNSKDETPERRTMTFEPKISDITNDDDEDDDDKMIYGGAAGTSADTTIQTRSNMDVKKVEKKVTEDFEDEPDESFYERVWGLTEMFPTPIRNVCGTLSDLSCKSVKTVFQFSCNASWIFFTTSMILFAPIIFESERAQTAEMMKTQQKQVLLGPGSAISSGGGGTGIPALPPMPSSR